MIQNKFPWLESISVLVTGALVGAFIFMKQYEIALISIGFVISGLIIAYWINYSNKRAEESQANIKLFANLAQIQINQIDKLLDRMQGVDPITNHNIHMEPIQPKESDKFVMDFQTLDGVSVRRVKT